MKKCLHITKTSHLIQFTKKSAVVCEQSARVVSVSEYKHCALTFWNLASYIYRTGVKLPSRCPILYLFYKCPY